ncbi:MAG: hypothetical protein HY289_04315 [Planctomycetes bacterium]|nr:hypothetical protein [Planctomycetota bacterium]
MATKKKSRKKLNGKVQPKIIFHPVIELDCSDWSAGIPPEKITTGRFRYPSVIAPPSKPERPGRKR